MSVLSNWKEVLDTANLSSDKEMDPVSKWLIITRAAVFSMTFLSGLIGGLLAITQVEKPDWLNFALAVIGLILAHAANNMTNDYFDLEAGVDNDEYARALYAPHPILSGLISKRSLLVGIVVINLFEAGIMLFLTLRSGWPVLLFAAVGLFISVFYVAPPIKLKHRGLGEPGVFLVWGPLMIGGSYYVTAGQMPSLDIWLATIPYAIIVTTVLIGKHIDKLEVDKTKGINTLPVLLGEWVSLILNMTLMIAYYAIIIGLVVVGNLGMWSLLVLLALPRLVQVLRIYREPKPSQPPEGYPVWPLWFVSASFYHNRLAGGLFVLSLILNWIAPLILRG